jgi:Transglutaminase-like superfamily
LTASTVDSKPASRLRAIVSLLASPADSWLAARTLGWLCALPVLKRALPLPKLVGLMWIAPHASERNLERERRMIRVIGRLSRVSGGNCLERSLILYRYLARANAGPRLVVGMAKPDEFLGHVWVTIDGRPLLETTKTLRGYEEVTTFADEGRRIK